VQGTKHRPEKVINVAITGEDFMIETRIDVKDNVGSLARK
jgi:hypothetical protein